MALSKKPYKGCRDFLPQQKRIQDYLFKVMRQTALSFGYEPYDGPLLEEVELYKAKSGEELINDQIYSFEDRGAREVAIRPEMTPTLARMIAGAHREAPKPIRWFSIPNLMRYERPQKGRLREHWQLNCDIFGAPGRSGEIEVLQLICALLENYGADESHFEILINDRTIVEAIFSKITDDLDTQYRLYKIVDKAKKLPKDALSAEVEKLNLQEDSTKLFNKYLELKGFDELFSFLREQNLSDQADSFKDFFETLKSYKLDKFIQYDSSIVRGLDYYTGVVFEVFDKNPDNRRAISGGGAYANLLQIFDEPAMTGVGFGLGDVTLKDFLEVHNLMPDFTYADNDIYLTFQTDQANSEIQKLAAKLRASGLNCVCALESVKFKKVFSGAQKLGAGFVSMLGDDELANKCVLIKNLATKEQKEFKLTDSEQIIDFITE